MLVVLAYRDMGISMGMRCWTRNKRKHASTRRMAPKPAPPLNVRDQSCPHGMMWCSRFRCRCLLLTWVGHGSWPTGRPLLPPA